MIKRPARIVGFYVTTRHQGKRMGLLGPYDTNEEALANEPRAKAHMIKNDLQCIWWDYSTAKVTLLPPKVLPQGKLNGIIGLVEKKEEADA